MIAFVTLFFGLLYGPVEIELSAAPGVERIELYVDGDLVSELKGPWVAKLDLGQEIVPRELVAVAKDAEGRRVGEVRQWINRPRPGAEASFVVEKEPNGSGRTARLLWRSATRSRVKSIRVSFDGLPVDVLLLGSGATEEGPITAERARRCLAKLGVPLFVWDVSQAPAKSEQKLAPRAEALADARSQWPEAVRVSGLTSLLGVFRSLEKELASQRIVWLKGRLNPAKVELTASAGKGISLVP